MITAIGLCMVILALLIIKMLQEFSEKPSMWFVSLVVVLFYAGLGFLFSSVITLLLRYAP